jgi:PIN domain
MPVPVLAGELSVDMPRRIAKFVERRGLPATVGDELADGCRAAVEANVTVLDEARLRSLRDPTDWPVVACALALAAGIWTNDNDFLGTGIATWTTESLKAWLDRQPR